MKEATAYYPLFADLTGRRCVVVGGGAVAQRKVSMLLRCGARVVVISPTVHPRLSAYVRQGSVQWITRRVRPADVNGAWLVYAATDDQRLNERVFRTATRRRILTNVVDQPSLCSFIAPAIVKRGPLTIAISTGGTSPTVAKQLRRTLEANIGPEYAALLRLLRDLRGFAKRKLPRSADRKRYFDRVANGQVMRLIRAGKAMKARQTALRLLEQASTTNGHSR